MIELTNDTLVFRFPDVHPHAELRIDFMRTLRIPDDGKVYPLPPGLGLFPLRHVDDYAGKVPVSWDRHGGVLMPMYQSEALWLFFGGSDVPKRLTRYPFAIKIAAGKIDAVTGKEWTNELHEAPQDYLVSHVQPWLDGFCVEKGAIRQFVAMPLGAGYSAEEQITGKGEHGGLQIIAYPMKRDVFERRFPELDFPGPERFLGDMAPCASLEGSAEMGLAPGGKMKQEIHEDPFDFTDWDTEHSSRCFVHIANSLVWRAITGNAPPQPPITAKHYTKLGLPWFEWYSDVPALDGSKELAALESVIQKGHEKGDVPLPENESVEPQKTHRIRQDGSQRVREGMI